MALHQWIPSRHRHRRNSRLRRRTPAYGRAAIASKPPACCSRTISYATYIWNGLLLDFFPGPFADRVVGVASVITIATVWYFALERPALHIKGSIRDSGHPDSSREQCACGLANAATETA